MTSEPLHDIAVRIRCASRVTVLTGAGVSVASGVPTFRGSDGLWKQHRPEDLTSPEAFQRDPQLVWEWYAWRRARIAACRPNAAHEIIGRWSRGHADCRVVTQNVDDLHVRAETRGLVRLHGSIWELRCSHSCPDGARPWRDEQWTKAVPRCPYCGGMARPAVVWFGEALDAEELGRAAEATACELFLTIGTSAVVYPAAGLVHAAKRHGAFTVEINPEATPASSLVDLTISDAAECVLPVIDRLI